MKLAPIGWQQARVIAVGEPGERQLFVVAHTLYSFRFRLGLGQRRQQQRRQDGDDGDNDKQLDKCEGTKYSPRSGAGFRSGGYRLIHKTLRRTVRHHHAIHSSNRMAIKASPWRFFMHCLPANGGIRALADASCQWISSSTNLATARYSLWMR